jgi:TrmH family RNA methyltransferase
MWAYEAAAAERPEAQRELQIVIADGGEGSVPYTDVDFTLPSVLVIGSEASGVSQVAYDAPGRVVRAGIPMFRQLESFNAAVAGSILLAEAARQRSAVASKDGEQDLR